METVCNIGDPGATASWDPNPFQTGNGRAPVADSSCVVDVCGDPGAEASASMDVLDNCRYVDVGKVVWDELHPYVVHNGVPVVQDGERVYYYKGSVWQMK